MLLLIAADLIAGFLIWLYAKDYFNRFTWWKAALLKSLVYSLFFGLAFLGKGGGDPGFMLPAPVLPAAVFTGMEDDFSTALRNVIIPYVCWVLLLLLFFSLRHLFSSCQAKTPPNDGIKM